MVKAYQRMVRPQRGGVAKPLISLDLPPPGPRVRQRSGQSNPGRTDQHVLRLDASGEEERRRGDLMLGTIRRFGECVAWELLEIGLSPTDVEAGERSPAAPPSAGKAMMARELV